MWLYHKVMSPKHADGMANSVDPDQLAPRGTVWSGSTLFAQEGAVWSESTLSAIPSASFGHITVRPPCSTFRLITAIFQVFKFFLEFYGSI